MLVGLLTLTVMTTVATAQNDKPLPMPTKAPATPVAVIDITRTQSESARQAIDAALTDSTVLEGITDRDLSAALTGDVASGALRRGKAALADAGRAANCTQATASLALATLDLASAQAAGVTVTGELRAAYAIAFRCAVEEKDRSRALHIAQRLRALGQTAAPTGIDDATWALYPELDGAANVTLAAVTIESTPPGAAIWVDHVERGVAPLELHLSMGTHVVAASSDAGVAARSINVTSWTHKESLAVAPAIGRWSTVAAQVSSIRSGKRAADGAAIAEIMTLSGADLALVIVGGGTIEAWQTKPGGGASRLGQRRDAKQIVALLASARGGARAPDPNTELLRETPAERAARERAKKGSEPVKWWVYAAVLSAAAIGTGIIVFGQSAEDRQRFEITLP